MISKRILVLLILFTYLLGSNVFAREIFFQDINVNKNSTMEWQKYTIKKGDTLYGIAKQYNVDWQDIENANLGIKATALKIGSIIQIPTKATGGNDQTNLKSITTGSIDQDKVKTHVIKKGDTLWALARDYGVPLNQLLSLNSNLNPKKLKIGQKIQLPTDVKMVSAAHSKVVTTSRSNVLKTGYFTLTAYTAGPESTGKSPGHPEYGITFSGVPVQKDVTIAVDPNVIPLGTRVFIEGIGYRVAHDTGGAIKGNRIDIYMEDLSEALQFGVKKNVRVDILQ